MRLWNSKKGPETNYVVVDPRVHACSKDEKDVLEKLEEFDEKTSNSYLMTKAWVYGGT